MGSIFWAETHPPSKLRGNPFIGLSAGWHKNYWRCDHTQVINDEERKRCFSVHNPAKEKRAVYLFWTFRFEMLFKVDLFAANKCGIAKVCISHQPSITTVTPDTLQKQFEANLKFCPKKKKKTYTALSFSWAVTAARGGLRTASPQGLWIF